MRMCSPFDSMHPCAPLVTEEESALVADLRREISSLQAELDRSDRLATLGAMSGAVAHEINNLLTPLLSYASFALSNPDDQQLARKALERTLQTAERARDVVDSLLRTVRLPEEDASRCETLVGDTVQEAVQMMVRPPQSRGIELIVDVPDDLVASISPASLQQIMLNLLLNACEAMQTGPGSIVITASKSKQKPFLEQSDSNTPVEIRVIDTGPGVQPDLRDRVFEPLVSSKAGTARGEQRGGSGFGLSVCKRLVEQVGGTIMLRSEIGIGSCFIVTLPPVSGRAIAQSAA